MQYWRAYRYACSPYNELLIGSIEMHAIGIEVCMEVEREDGTDGTILKPRVARIVMMLGCWNELLLYVGSLSIF